MLSFIDFDFLLYGVISNISQEMEKSHSLLMEIPRPPYQIRDLSE